MAAPERTGRQAAGISQLENTDAELDSTFMKLVTSPTVASKEWVYRQYDHTVRTNTVVLPGSDAAVIRIKETRKALAMTLDSNARYCTVDPRAGARLIVAEGCRNLVASGARPLALTNCMNFASPERPEVMWQFSETVDGMAEACRAFGTPVTGGNVSFYNETEGSGIFPTPVIGMVGLVEDTHHITTQWFKHEDRVIVLLGATADDLGASLYLEALTGRIEGPAPALDLDRERAVQDACLKIIRAGLAESGHDCSDGGLAISLAESAFSSYRRQALGFSVDLEGDLPAAVLLFGESPSRIVISTAEVNLSRVFELAAESGVPATVLGKTGGDRIVIGINGKSMVDRSIAEVESEWRGVLPRMLEVASLVAEEILAS